MTIATFITLSRLFSVVAILPLIYMNSHSDSLIALMIFIGAVISDMIDGIVARTFNQVTALGAKLDPLVDKILIYSMLFMLVEVKAIDPIFVFPMFIRDMVVDGMRNEAARTSNILGANMWGKAKFGLQSISIISSLCFCITQREEFVNGANAALFAALVVSIPGLVTIAAAFGTAFGKNPVDENAPSVKLPLMPRFS